MLNKLKMHNPFLFVILMYIVVCMIGMFILQSNLIINEGYDVSLLEAFFTSVSSFATTGLVVFDYTEVYNYFGWIILIIFFNIGGMGIMTVNTILFLLVGKKIGVKNRMLAKIDQNNLSTEDMVTILKRIVIMFVSFELIGSFIIFMRIGYMNMDFVPRLLNSIFMASSAISGSGFYNTVPYAHDYVTLSILILLMIFSFIGYPVLIDILEYIKHKKLKKKSKYKFSIFTKIVVKVNIVTVIIFAILFLALEANNTMSQFSFFDQIFYSFYISISTKSVGLNVFNDITLFNDMTLLFSMIFMIIGGSPSSACGGIRVTTIYVIYAFIKSEMKGHTRSRYKNYYISLESTIRAFFIVIMFFIISFIFLLAILVTNRDLDIFYTSYEVISAFSTTGFSTGITDQLNNIGIFLLALLMLIGRVGIMNIANSMHTKKNTNKRVNYVEQKITL